MQRTHNYIDPRPPLPAAASSPTSRARPHTTSNRRGPRIPSQPAKRSARPTPSACPSATARQTACYSTWQRTFPIPPPYPFHSLKLPSSNTTPSSADNTNYNPMSPYTFYDVSCPAELPVRKRQIGIELPGGIGISLGLDNPKQISSACSCFITSGPASTTVTKTSDVVQTRTATATTTITTTARG